MHNVELMVRHSGPIKVGCRLSGLEKFPFLIYWWEDVAYKGARLTK